MKPQFVTIKSDGTNPGTKILVNGVELETRSIKLIADANSREPVTVLVDLYVDRVEMEGMALVVEGARSHRAVEFEKKLEKLNRLAGQMSPDDVEALINSIGK